MFLQLLSAPLLPLLRGVPWTRLSIPPTPQGVSATITHTALVVVVAKQQKQDSA